MSAELPRLDGKFDLQTHDFTNTEQDLQSSQTTLQLADKRLHPLVFWPESLSEAWSCAVELTWLTFPGRADALPFGP